MAIADAVAVDALRRRRRAASPRRSPGPSPRSACRRRSSRTVRPGHLRSRLPAPGRRGAAHRARPRRPLPGRLPGAARARAGAGTARASARRSAGFVRPTGAPAGDLGLPVRRRPRGACRSWRCSTSPTTCSSCSSTARSPSTCRACRRAGSRSRTSRPAGRATISRRAYAALAERARDWQDQTRAAARDAELDVVRARADEARRDLALSEFVVERRLRRSTR